MVVRKIRNYYAIFYKNAYKEILITKKLKNNDFLSVVIPDDAIAADIFYKTANEIITKDGKSIVKNTKEKPIVVDKMLLGNFKNFNETINFFGANSGIGKEIVKQNYYGTLDTRSGLHQIELSIWSDYRPVKLNLYGQVDKTSYQTAVALKPKTENILSKPILKKAQIKKII